MNVEYLLDTKILLYAISTDPAERPKKEIARQIMTADNWGLSVQILQEFYVNATRQKGTIANALMSLDAAAAAVEQFLFYPVVENTQSMLIEAMAIQRKFKISYWDAAVIAAAHKIGAKILYSEDLNHGQDYGGVRVVNPFL